uniref:Uncharacterized protein n=1 Tax=Stomoxys calcitrans TaxID=35570 RepID=A0A1I8PMU5_STOCA
MDDYNHYAEIDVLASNDYYYITNLNHYYEQQHNLKSLRKSTHQCHHNRYYQHYQRRDCDSSSSSSSSPNNRNIFLSNRSTSVFTQCHTQSKLGKSRYYQHQSYQPQPHQQQHNNLVTGHRTGLAAVDLKNTNNILRNTQKRCRRQTVFTFPQRL